MQTLLAIFIKCQIYQSDYILYILKNSLESIQPTKPFYSWVYWYLFIVPAIWKPGHGYLSQEAEASMSKTRGPCLKKKRSLYTSYLRACCRILTRGRESPDSLLIYDVKAVSDVYTGIFKMWK